MKSRYHFLLPEVEAALASPNFFTAVKKHATRYSYSESLMEVAEINPKVVVLDVESVSRSRPTSSRKNTRIAPLTLALPNRT